MRTRSKKPVWLLFKVLELVLSGTCCYFHIGCFKSARVTHTFLLCTTYGGSSIICILAIMAMFYTDKSIMKVEGTFGAVLGTLNMITVYANMYLAEHDIHLVFLKNREESGHEFYNCCYRNAMLALYAAAVFFLHCTFALDMMYTHRGTILMGAHGHKYQKHRQRSKRPLKLYFISIGIENYLSGFEWSHYLLSIILRGRSWTKRSTRRTDTDIYN